MKTLLFIVNVMFIGSAVASYDQEITCQHSSGTEVVKSITLKYQKNASHGWLKNVDISVVSNFEDTIATGDHQGQFESFTSYSYPTYSGVYFEPCLDCDFDSARVDFMHDDDLGIIGTLQYSSDGPRYAQILSCQASSDW